MLRQCIYSLYTLVSGATIIEQFLFVRSQWSSWYWDPPHLWDFTFNLMAVDPNIKVLDLHLTVADPRLEVHGGSQIRGAGTEIRRDPAQFNLWLGVGTGRDGKEGKEEVLPKYDDEGREQGEGKRKKRRRGRKKGGFWEHPHKKSWLPACPCWWQWIDWLFNLWSLRSVYHSNCIHEPSTCAAPELMLHFWNRDLRDRQAKHKTAKWPAFY